VTAIEFQQFSSYNRNDAGGWERRISHEANPTATSLTYSRLFGGARDENPNGLAIDPMGKIYIAGSTSSQIFQCRMQSNCLRPA